MSHKQRFISAQESREQVTREKLLETALNLVDRYGMSYLTIRNICDEAGISTGSFYNLFDGKDELVAYYLRDVFTSYKQKAAEQAVGHTALERVILIYRFYIDCVLETGVEFITGLYSSITNPVFNFLDRAPEDEIVLDQVRHDLEEGIVSGEIKTDVKIDEAMLRIAIIITGSIFYWCAFGGRIDLAQQADSMLQNYLHTLAVDEDRPFDVPSLPRDENTLI